MFLIGYLVAAVVVLLTIYFLIDMAITNKAVKDIDGPTFRSILLKMLKRDKGESVFHALQTYSSEYGRIFKVRFFNKMVLVTNDPGYIQKMLTSKESLHKPPLMYNVLNLPLGLVCSKYDMWRQHRKIINPTFNAKILESFIPIFIEKTELLVDDLEKRVGKPSFDILDTITHTTLQTAIGTTMGFEGMDKSLVQKMTKEFHTALMVTGHRVYNLELLPDLLYKWSNIYNGLYEKEQKIRKYLCSVVNEIIKNKQASFDETLIPKEDEAFNKPQLFINQLIMQSEDKQNGVRLSIDEIRDECYTVIAGGTETSALTVAYMCLLLAEHSDVQDRVFAEINEQYPSFDEPLTTEILSRLPYMEMVIKETLRLITIIPFIAREVKSDLKLEECTMKPGMVMIINMYSLHRRKDLWGDDADEFNPDRFLPENVEKRHPFCFVPFSAGARNCVGYRYAFISMKIMLVYMLKNYRISSKIKLTDYRFRYTMTLNLFNKHMIQVERRHPQK